MRTLAASFAFALPFALLLATACNERIDRLPVFVPLDARVDAQADRDASLMDASVDSSRDAASTDSSRDTAIDAARDSSDAQTTNASGHVILAASNCPTGYTRVGANSNGFLFCYSPELGTPYNSPESVCARGMRVGPGAIPQLYASVCVVPETWLFVSMRSSCPTGYETVTTQAGSNNLCGKASGHATIETEIACPSDFDLIGQSSMQKNICESRVDGTSFLSRLECPTNYRRAGDFCFGEERAVLALSAEACAQGWSEIGTASYSVSTGDLRICKKN